MEMAPLQKPHPPLWYGAHSPESAERAARKGFNIVTNDAPGNARSIIDRYRQVWQRTQIPNAIPKIGLVRFIVVAETDGDALTMARARLFALAFEFCLSVGNARCIAGFAAECGKLRPAY